MRAKERKTQVLGERQSIAQKGVRAIDARHSQLENGSNATKTTVSAPELSTDERETPFCVILWGWLKSSSFKGRKSAQKRVILANNLVWKLPNSKENRVVSIANAQRTRPY